jgi:hypothetical protein
MDEYILTAIGIACTAGVKLICFFLGYKTIKLGYQLMKEGIKGEFNFSADYKGLKGGLISSSPGLLFLLLGILLIGYAMGVKKAVSMESQTPIKNERTLPGENKDNLKDSI